MQTVLVVEDDDAVRRVVSRMLAEAGYAVLAANGGREALRISKRHEGRIDVIVTDVVMPHMSGVALVNELTDNRPDLIAVYVSGYLDDKLQEYGLSPESDNFLPKPFSRRDLVQKLCAVPRMRANGAGGK